MVIKNVFRCDGDVIVLACQASGDVGAIRGRAADIFVDGVLRQRVVLAGERHMLNQKAHKFDNAIEIREDVAITMEEALSGNCTLILVG